MALTSVGIVHGFTIEHIRADRILDEALTAGPDPLRLSLVFGERTDLTQRLSKAKDDLAAARTSQRRMILSENISGHGCRPSGPGQRKGLHRGPGQLSHGLVDRDLHQIHLRNVEGQQVARRENVFQILRVNRSRREWLNNP